MTTTPSLRPRSATLRTCLLLLVLCATIAAVGTAHAQETTDTTDIESTQLILFDGEPEKWSSILPSNEAAMSSAIVEAIQELLFRPSVTLTITVNSLEVYPADPSFTSMGDGTGGLLATVNIVAAVAADAQHAYDTSEVNSILFGLTVPELSTLYGSTVRVQTVSVDQNYKLQCTPLCKGMIATGSILGFVMLVFLVLLIVYSCCPSCFSKFKAQEEEKASSP